jgi:MFS family permease
MDAPSAPPTPLAGAPPEKSGSLSTAPPSWPSSGLAATFRALRHRNYRLYFFGQLVSLIGTWMQTTALNWLAFDLTHESKWPALLMAVGILPTFFLGAWGGALADRWPKRSLIIGTQGAFLVLALILAALAGAGVVVPWQLLVITACVGLVQAIDLPARLAFVMDLAGREDLINAVALNSLLFNVARVVGPALAGQILAWSAPWTCFLANGLSYLAVLHALVQINVAGTPRVAESHRERPSLRSSFGYLARHRELAFLFLLSGTTSFCGWPSQALLPALAKHELATDEAGYSWLLSGTGLGALAAAWVVATFGSVERRGLFIGIGVCVVCTALLGLSLMGSLVPAIGCCALLGFGLILFLATTQSVIQLGADEHNRGQIMGIWAMTQSGALPFGNLLAGPAADYLGVPLVLRIQGVACGVAALGLTAYFLLGKRVSLPSHDTPSS